MAAAFSHLVFPTLWQRTEHSCFASLQAHLVVAHFVRQLQKTWAAGGEDMSTSPSGSSARAASVFQMRASAASEGPAAGGRMYGVAWRSRSSRLRNFARKREQGVGSQGLADDRPRPKFDDLGAEIDRETSDVLSRSCWFVIVRQTATVGVPCGRSGCTRIRLSLGHRNTHAHTTRT